MTCRRPEIAKDALAQLAGSCPDVVLLDAEMSEMDGIDVLLSLKAREETRGISVIMVASHGRDDKVVAALELGATDLIPKPVSARTSQRGRRKTNAHSSAEKPVPHVITRRRLIMRERRRYSAFTEKQ
jgi:CheY-like chemotaxis protein